MAQIVAFAPAEAVAIGLIVKVISSVAAVQGPTPSGSLVVMVNMIVPAAISAIPGV